MRRRAENSRSSSTRPSRSRKPRRRTPISKAGRRSAACCSSHSAIGVQGRRAGRHFDSGRPLERHHDRREGHRTRRIGGVGEDGNGMVAGSISKRGLGLIDGAKPFADEAAESGVAAARIVLGRVRMLTGPRGKRMIGMNEGVRGVLPGYFVNRETQLDATVVAQWAYKERLWRPDPIDPVRMLARQLSRAWRQEYYVDRQGREVRLNHHVSIEQE